LAAPRHHLGRISGWGDGLKLDIYHESLGKRTIFAALWLGFDNFIMVL
jgi:hypothetical protein